MIQLHPEGQAILAWQIETKQYIMILVHSETNDKVDNSDEMMMIHWW